MIGLRLFQPLPGETFSVLFSPLNSKIYFKEIKGQKRNSEIPSNYNRLSLRWKLMALV